MHPSIQAGAEPPAIALAEKERALHDALHDCGSVVLGYSGGVDSTYLAKAALDALGPERVLAVTGRSPSYPDVQYRTALDVARRIGLPHREIDTREIDDPNYVANPSDRCYYCKSELFGRLTAIAGARNATVIDGSNADDRSDYRPGAAAGRERGVRSPLQEAGLTKDEIRTLSRRAGLPTWDAPASPCLASRIPYGIAVTRERLGQIEAAEARLRALRSWGALRVRHHGVTARLEAAVADLAALADGSLRAGVAEALRAAGFANACVDLAGYRQGALNEALGATDDERTGGRAAAVRSALVERGVDVRVELAGGDGDVAVLWPAADVGAAGLIEEREAVVAAARSAGCRYVTLGLYRG